MIAILLLACSSLLACAPMVDIDGRVGTYCADICFENPAWLDAAETDEWGCTLDCESNENVSQAMLSCMGQEGSDEEGLAKCELLLGESVGG